MPGALMLLNKHVLAAGFVVFVVLGSHAAVWPGHVEFSLGLLDGTDGFRITADASDGRLGYSVSAAGDVNDDGFKDIILGESPESSSTAGAAYVVFGSEAFSTIELDISALDGTNGFKIEGTDNGDYAGTAVAGVGDVNGDGFDDVMVGAWGASSAAGEILVVFGAATFPEVVIAADLDGSRGFLVRGATTSDAAGFNLAAAGDVNGDGAADMVIGAHQADPSGSMSGKAYIIFGVVDWATSVVDLADLGAGGLTFEGSARRAYLGHRVAGAGDANGDGYSDVIISAYGADEAYVFYGAPAFSSTDYELAALSGTDGFIISTGNDGDVIVVAGAGDLNGDGYGDIAIGHPLADPSSDNSAGAVYVVLGGGTIQSPVSVQTDLDGSNGFTLKGASAGDRSGTSVSGAGDINQDGFGDLVVGAPGVGNDAGSVYIVFGSEEYTAASYTLGSIGADGSFILNAPSDNGYGGFSVAGTGDINQDGFPDLIVGAYGSGTAGEAFAVFPHLTGTPPPTVSPVAAPTGSTPSPVLTTSGPVSSSTPAPTSPTPAPTLAGAGPTPSPTLTPAPTSLAPSSTPIPSTLAPFLGSAGPIGPMPLPTPAPLVPTQSPTRAPIGSTPSLAPAVVRATPSPNSSAPVVVGRTPAPTTNFLSAGVVGSGTVYNSPGVFVQAEELGGMVSLGEDELFDEDTRVSISLESLQEKSAEGSLVGLGAATPHIVNGGSLVYEAGATTNVSAGGIAAQEGVMTASMLGGESSVTITMQVFEEAGLITSGDEQTHVAIGDLKFSISVTDWPFCDPSTAPSSSSSSSSSSQETPSTVCVGASSVLEAGAYLDAILVVQGPSSSTPILQDEETGEGGGGTAGGGLKYGMSGGSAKGTLVMSEWVNTDGYGWTKAEKLSLSGSSFTVRFPASAGTLYYDPTLELVLTPGEREGFWRHTWFVWAVSVLGVSMIILLLCCTARRRSWIRNEKVSPRFEGVAPAVDSSVDGRAREEYVGFFTCFRNRNRKDTPRGRSKGAAITREATVRIAPVADDEGRSDDTAADNLNKAAPSEGGAVVTPDHTKNRGGNAGAAGRETSANNVENPNLLPDAADPGAAQDANNADAATEWYYEDSRHYDQEYEGYEGYSGYGGYDAYGYDGYGYDGYYDPRYYWQDTAVAANEGSSSSPLAAAVATPPSAALAAGVGADLSPLGKAPSPKNGDRNRQEIGEGDAEAERKPRSVGRNGTGAGAVQLPPIGGVTTSALPPRPASR